jgi:hypothetical protein
MELRMSSDLNDTRRAKRLLRWYPPAWRERYGEEFVDHLRQEFADRPADLRRSVNVAYKGLVARAGDIGLSKSGVNLGGQTRAALGTSLAFIALMVVIMLDFWSRAMLAWSGRRYHPIPVSATTGILTIAMGLLVVLLAGIVLAVAIFVARQILRRRVRQLAVPSILAVASGGFLLYAGRIFPSLLAPYIHHAHSLQGMSLSQPGTVITNLAQVTWELTQRWVAPWNQGMPGISTIQTVVDDCVPLAMFIFGVALALLIRRVELPRASERLVFSTVALLGTFTGVFFVTYIAWSAVGGPSNDEYFFPETPWLGVVYLILLALIPLLVIRSGLLARRNQPHRQRNHIEIVGSKNELA